MNLQTQEFSEWNSDSNTGWQPKKLVRIRIFLGDKKFIHKRKVYDLLNFSGDAGGIYSAMMFVGAVLHYCLSYKEYSKQLIERYFRVNMTPSTIQRKMKAEPSFFINENKTIQFGTLQLILHNTIIRAFLSICCFSRRRGKLCLKQQHVERLISKTER